MITQADLSALEKIGVHGIHPDLFIPPGGTDKIKLAEMGHDKLPNYRRFVAYFDAPKGPLGYCTFSHN